MNWDKLEKEEQELYKELDEYEFEIEFWEEGSDSDLEELKAKALELEYKIYDIQKLALRKFL